MFAGVDIDVNVTEEDEASQEEFEQEGEDIA